MAFQIHDFLYVNILYFDIVYFSLYFSLKMAPLFLDRRRFFSMAFIIFLIWFKEFFSFWNLFQYMTGGASLGRSTKFKYYYSF